MITEHNVKKRILILAGEASGDMHGAELIKASLKQNPDLEFYGMGGKAMQRAGANISIDNTALSVIGVVEVLKHISIFRKTINTLKQLIHDHPPDLIIYVDYPGMNLRIAKYAHKKQVNSLYYISPQLWAWKKGRIKIIQQCISKIAVIFPFEVDFYRKNNVDAAYVGNPLVEKVKPTLTHAQCYIEFGLDEQKPVVALLPGSRQSELKFMFDTILQTAQRVQNQHPDVQWIIPISSQFNTAQLKEKIAAFPLTIKLIPNQLYNILQISDAALCVSGTVTLEVALMGTPFAILYKLNQLTYYIGRMLIDVDAIGLCNLVAEKVIAKEFIQHEANPTALSAEVIRLLEDKAYADSQREHFAKLREKFYKYPRMNIGELVAAMMDYGTRSRSHLIPPTK